MGTRRGEEAKNRFSGRCTLHHPRPWIYIDAEWSKWAGALIVPANGLGQSLVPARLARGYPLAAFLTLGCVACRSGLACSVDFRPRGFKAHTSAQLRAQADLMGGAFSWFVHWTINLLRDWRPPYLELPSPTGFSKPTSRLFGSAIQSGYFSPKWTVSFPSGRMKLLCDMSNCKVQTSVRLPYSTV